MSAPEQTNETMHELARQIARGMTWSDLAEEMERRLFENYRQDPAAFEADWERENEE